MKNSLRYMIYMRDRINSEINAREIISKSYSLEQEFWKLWKVNIFKKNNIYKDDNYEFMCVKTLYHKNK